MVQWTQKTGNDLRKKKVQMHQIVNNFFTNSLYEVHNNEVIGPHYSFGPEIFTKCNKTGKFLYNKTDVNKFGLWIQYKNQWKCLYSLGESSFKNNLENCLV